MSESPLHEEVRKKVRKGPMRSPPPARRPRKKDTPPPIPTSNLLRFPLTTAQSAMELMTTTPSNHDANYVAISGGIRASSMSNLVWSQKRKSSDLNLSAAQLTNLAISQRPGFGVRVELPNGVISVLLCHHAMDLLCIVNRAVSRTKTLLGIAYDISDINSVKVFADTDDMQELVVESVMTNIPYVVSCLQKKVQPAFIVECPLCPQLRPQMAVHHGAEPTSAVEENETSPELWDEDNKSYGTLSKASFKNLRMSFHKPRSTSNASQSDKPIPPLPNSTTPTTGGTSPAVKPLEQQRTPITVAEILVAASSRPSSKISAPSVLAEMEVEGISSISKDVGLPVRAPSVQPKTYTATFILPMELISRVSMSSSSDAETTITMSISGTLSIKEVKESVCTHRKMPPLPQPPDQYCLKFTNEKEQEIVLFDEDQIFRTVSCVKYRTARGMPITFNVTLRNVPLSKQAQRINKSIGALIGFGLYRFERVDPEIDYVRRRLVNCRRDAVDSRDPRTYTMEPTLDVSMPAIVKEKLLSSKLQLRLHVNTVVKTTTCEPEDTPSEIIKSLLRKKTISLLELEDSGADKYVLKVSGVDDYLTGEHPLINYAYIRKCILKDERINLILVAKPEPVDLSRLLDDYDLIEECPGLGNHAQLTVESPNAEDIKVMSLWDVTRNYRIMISECIRLTPGNFESVYVEAGLYYGGVLLCPIQTTPAVKNSANPKWNTWLTFDIATCNLPKSARLCLTVYSRWNSKKRTALERDTDVCPLGWVNMLLMNYKGFLRMGPAPVRLPLWGTTGNGVVGERANPIGTCVSTEMSAQNPALILHLEEYEKPVMFPTEQFTDELKAKCEKALPPKDEHHVQILEETINADPLTKVNDGNATLLWRYRYYCTRRAEALPKIILATRWNNLEDVLELQKLLPVWAPMSPEASLELLDANFPDEAVRTLAVSRLEMLSDERVLDYLLQLVQVLKYEPFHDSALSRFLLKRALKNRLLGHYFFWHLRSEMSQPEVSLRFGMLLEAYLRGAENHMEELMHQNETLNQLSEIAGQVKTAKTAVEKRDVLMGELSRVHLPNKFTLSLNPRIKAKSIIVEKCKYMDSKKLPLWCVFENADARGSPIYIIFKSGDDLRQDMLTLQMIGIMDKLWQQDGLDLRMTPYRCIATGHEVGMIEVVLNAETVSNIQLQYGGSSAAFKDQPLDEWIRKHNVLEKDYVKAVETFTYSCAGYCVATYVLGIGDRHNDNIMVTKSGHLFHIDFGHFLGNIKRKFGIKRERAPFVLTPDFVYVMGRRDGEQFKKFVEYCIQAYLILRRKANMFINLFAMMLSTGIPELKSSDDIQYLRDALCIGMTEEAAANEFRSLIFESLRLGWSTQLNWWLHNLVHSK